MSDLQQPLAPSQVRYTVGSTAQAGFPVPFRFDDQDELYVTVNGAAVTAWSLDFDIEQDGIFIQSAVILATPVADAVVVITRGTEQSQGAVWPNGVAFNIKALNAEFSRVWMSQQDDFRRNEQGLRVPYWEAAVPMLPVAAERANKTLGFDSAGFPSLLATLTGPNVATPYGIKLIQSANALQARDILGMRRYVNVATDFNTVGDGVADDRAAIQAAIDTGWPVIYFPPGTYGIRGSINLRPNQMLVADDPQACFIKPLVGAINCLLHSITGATQTGFIIRNLGFDMRAVSGCNGIGLIGLSNTQRVANVKIEDCYFAGGSNGIFVRRGSNVEATRCSSILTASCMQFDNCTDVDVVGGHADGGTGYGISIFGDDNTFYLGARITGFSTRGQAGGLAINAYPWGSITGCHFFGTTTQLPLSMTNAAHWQVSNSVFIGNASTTPGAIFMDNGCDNCLFSNNTIGWSQIGHYLAGKEHVVSGNIYTQNTGSDLTNVAVRSTVIGNVFTSPIPISSVIEQAAAAGINTSANVAAKPFALSGSSPERAGGNLVFP